MDTLFNWIIAHSNIFTQIWFFFVTLVGAVITQLLSLKIGTVGATPFLTMWFPNRKKDWYLRANCITLVFVGAILSYVILEPSSLKTSLCAGLTWCGTLQSLGLIKEE